MPGESRAAIIDAAARLFRQQGYDATSWRQVIRESGAPAGSVSYLFPDGKEQMASDVVAQSAAETRNQIVAILGVDEDPVTVIRRWIEVTASILEASDFTDGCPLATISLEMSHRSESIQREVASGYESWITALSDHLRPTEGERADDIAELVLAALEGALLLSRSRRTTQPLRVLAANAHLLLDRP